MGQNLQTCTPKLGIVSIKKSPNLAIIRLQHFFGFCWRAGAVQYRKFPTKVAKNSFFGKFLSVRALHDQAANGNDPQDSVVTYCPKTGEFPSEGAHGHVWFFLDIISSGVSRSGVTLCASEINKVKLLQKARGHPAGKHRNSVTQYHTTAW